MLKWALFCYCSFCISSICLSGYCLTEVNSEVKQLLKRSHTRRILVFVHAIPHGEALAKEFNCDFYHGNAKFGELMLQRYLDGKAPLLVATSALGLGVDVSDISDVVHFGRPFTLVEYMQQSGRAGRDGQPARSTVWLTTVDVKRNTSHRSDPDQTALSQFLATSNPTCRRAILRKYFDSAADDGVCYSTENKCDVCRPLDKPIRPATPPASSISDRSLPILLSPTATQHISSSRSTIAVSNYTATQVPTSSFILNKPSSRVPVRVPSDSTPSGRAISAAGKARSDLIEYKQQETQRKSIQLRIGRSITFSAGALSYAVDWMADACVYCAVLLDQDSRDHQWSDCSKIPAEIKSAWTDRSQQIQRTIRYAPYIGCWVCGRPFHLCPTYTKRPQQERYDKNGEKECSDIPLLSRTVAAMEGCPVLWKAMDITATVEKAGLDSGNAVELIRFYGNKIRDENVEMSRLMWTAWTGAAILKMHRVKGYKTSS